MAFFSRHVARALGRLTSRRRRAPRTRALVEALAAELQELEDVAQDIALSLSPSAAPSSRLPVLIRLLGGQPGGLGEARLRAYVRARVIALKARGSRDAIKRALYVLFPGAEIHYVDLFPAGFGIDIHHDPLTQDEELARLSALIVESAPAGVGVLVQEACPDGFRFDTEGRGFDSPLGRTIE